MASIRRLIWVATAAGESDRVDDLWRGLAVDVLEVSRPPPGPPPRDLDAIVIDGQSPFFDAWCESRDQDPAWREIPVLLWIGEGSTAALGEVERLAADTIVLRGSAPELNRQKLERLVNARFADRALSFVLASFDANVTGISVVDARSAGLPLVYVSSVFEAMTGYSAEESLGRNCRFLQGPATDRAAVSRLAAAIAARRSTREILLNYRKDGTTFWNELTVFPVRDDRGDVAFFGGVQHDVTELVEARDRSERAHAVLAQKQRFAFDVLDGLHSAVIATDPRGAVTFVNRAACVTLARSARECVGKPVADVLKLPPNVGEAFDQCDEDEVARCRYTYRRHDDDGGAVEMGLSISRPRGSGLGYLFTFRDLGQSQAEERDARRIERLAAMGTMVAGFAHEVRNPVASIRLLVEGLEMETDDGVRADCAARIRRQLDRIERLVRTSLQFGKPEAPRRAEHPPLRITAATIDALLPRTRDREGWLRLEHDERIPTVYVDDGQIAQALIILVNNALDATSDVGSVMLRVRRDVLSIPGNRIRVAAVCFDVIDDGPGIAAENLSHVFDPFFTTRPSGTGLGLSIAQQLVHENGGRLEIASIEGRGTTASILVPEGHRGEAGDAGGRDAP